MQTLSYSNVLTDVMQHADELLQSFVHELYVRLSSYLHWPFLLCIQLYLILIGYGILNGWFVIAWRSMGIICYKIATAVVLMTQWDTVNAYVIQPLIKGSNELAAVITNAMPSDLSKHKTVIELSQNMLVEVTRVGLWLWHGGSLLNYSRLLAGLSVWVCGVGVTLYGFIQIMIAHIILYVMLALAPIFIVLSLFYRSSRLTWRWISICLSCVLLVLFLSSVMSLSMTLIHQVFDWHYSQHARSFKLVDVFPVVVVSALSFVVMRRMVQLAEFVSVGIVDVAQQYVQVTRHYFSDSASQDKESNHA